jgi:L-asparaginase II
VVEAWHRVNVVVVREGRVVARHGRGDLPVIYRSAAKPFQALPLVEDGAVDRFGLTGAELALAAASHSGEEAHLEGVRAILAKVGLGEEALRLGPSAPLGAAAAAALCRSGAAPRPIHNNCSGQHAAMLGLARVRGWPVDSYLDPFHPLQRRMLEVIARFTGLAPGEIATMPDGCGMVAFAVPLEAMARSFVCLAERAGAEEAPRRVLEAMSANPFMVGGSGRLCTTLGESSRGRVVGKLGAEGVYGVAVPERCLGFALKVDDGGGGRAGDPAVVRVLDELGLLSPEEAAALEAFRRPQLRNTLGEVVGEVRAAFGLEWDADGPGA